MPGLNKPLQRVGKIPLWTISVFAQFCDLFVDIVFQSNIKTINLPQEIKSQSIETLKEKVIGLILFMLSVFVIQTLVNQKLGNCCHDTEPRRRGCAVGSYRDAGALGCWAVDRGAADWEEEVAKGRVAIQHHSPGKTCHDRKQIKSEERPGKESHRRVT